MSLRLIKHFFAIAGGQGLNLVSTILLVPLFLKHWSAFTYGEWLVLSSLTSYLSTMDLGMNSAVSNRLLGAYVRQDLDDYKKCQHSAIVFYLCLAVGMTALLALAVHLLPIAQWAGVKQAAVPDAGLILWLLALQVLWMMPVGLIGNFYATVEDPVKSKWINNFRAIGTLCVTVTVLLLGAKMRTLAAAQFLPVLCTAVYVLWDIRRRYPRFFPGWSQAHLHMMRALLKPSLLFALMMVAAAIVQQGSVMVVSTVMGGVAVALLVTTRTLTNLVMQVVRMIAYTAWPDMTILFSKQDFARLRLLNRLVVTTSMVLCIAIAAALWFEGGDVIRVWTHNKLHADTLFLRLLLLYLVLQSAWLANSMVTAAVNLHQTQSWASLAAGVLAVIAMRLLMPRWGLIAVPLGLILGEALACYHFVIKNTCAVLQEDYPAAALRTWGGKLLIFAPTLGVAWLMHQIAWGPSQLRWAEVGIATLATSWGIAWGISFGQEERAVLRSKAQTILQRVLPRRSAAQCASGAGI